MKPKWSKLKFHGNHKFVVVLYSLQIFFELFRIVNVYICSLIRLVSSELEIIRQVELLGHILILFYISKILFYSDIKVKLHPEHSYVLIKFSSLRDEERKQI